MEAVARQFATGRKCLVIRNGWFSYRWSQIFEMGRIPPIRRPQGARCRGRAQGAVRTRTDRGSRRPHSRGSARDGVRPHVETAAGMMLPDDYLKAVADAVHEVGGLFVLDCIASGTIWVDMQATGVDILISAPQKGWSGSPCCAFVALSAEARKRIDATTSTSFACDLRKWLQIMEAYEGGGHAYHATMPTDALGRVRDVMLETEQYGFDKVKAEQLELGQQVRALLEGKGFPACQRKASRLRGGGELHRRPGDPVWQSFSPPDSRPPPGTAAMRRTGRFQNLPGRLVPGSTSCTTSSAACSSSTKRSSASSDAHAGPERRPLLKERQ